MRILKIRQSEEEESLRLQKIAFEESDMLLQRLRDIEDQEMIRRKAKYYEKLDAEVEAEKQRNLRLIELEAEKIKENQYRIYRKTNDFISMSPTNIESRREIKSSLSKIDTRTTDNGPFDQSAYDNDEL